MKKIIIILFILNLFHIHSEDLKKEKWTVHWGEFKGINLSLSNQYLVTTIPAYLMENIPADYKHYPDSSESLLIYMDLIESRIIEVKKNRLMLLEQKDEMLFDKNSTEEGLKIVQDKIKASDEELEELNKIDIMALKPIESLDIEYFPKSREELKHIEEFEIGYFLKRKNVDYYISGTIEEINNNLFIEVELYSKYSDQPELIYNGIGDSDDIIIYRDDILDKLIKKITSEKMIQYSIAAEPDDSLIYVNDDFKSLGRYNGYAIDGELLNIDILKEGYETLSIDRVVSLNNNLFEEELTYIQREFVTVESNPEGAKAYYGSKFIGYTPIEVAKYSYPLKLTLSLEGYMDKNIVIDLNSNDMSVDLTEGIIDIKKNFEDEKRKFYQATAIFSFSLAVPLFLNAQSDIISSYNTATEKDQLVYNISVVNAVVWGINIFYRLYRYLKAAELSVE